MNPIQYLRSLVFVGQMYLMMAVLGIVFIIPMALHPSGAVWGAKVYCRWVLWTAKWMVGLDHDIRGEIPTQEVLIASKHQSFLDIILIFHALPHAKFIMKRSLMYAPVIGQYGLRMGAIPVSRGKKAEAVKKMLADVEAGRDVPGQLVIYPQGTRVAPGVKKSYKVGAAALYQAMDRPCVPVAVNVGVFWPRTGIYRKPGTAVVKFLEPIAPGFDKNDFLARIEDVIEAESTELLDEAGFKP